MGFFDIITVVLSDDEPESQAEEATDFTEGCSSCGSVAAETIVDDVSPPADLNGRVKLVNSVPLGTGGYAILHMGELSQAGGCQGKVKVAVKLFYADEGDADAVSKRVAREIRINRRISHSNILPFLGVCTDFSNEGGDFSTHGIPAIVVPLCEGRTIDRYLRKNPATLRRPLILDISHGLAYLHSNNVVHGDLKPDNILIHLEGDTVKAVLADFGRSRVEGREGFTTVLASSLVFTAPELLGFDEPDSILGAKQMPTVTKPADIYALGLVMLNILSGKMPFYTKATQSKSAASTSNRLERAHYECSEMNDAIWELMADCWAIQPAKRPEIDHVTIGLHAIVNGSRPPHKHRSREPRIIYINPICF